MLNPSTLPESQNASPAVQQSLSDRELSKISALIYQRAGIVLTPQKRDMVYNRLLRRLRTLGLSGFHDYIRLLESRPAGEEWQEFVNSLTTNLTSFFREAYHFPVLAEHARSRRGNYNVWCTASSTGEEAYSIAITLEEALGSGMPGPRVWATDINTDVLSKAMSGIYRLSDIDALTQGQKKSWFLRGKDASEGWVKVNKQLHNGVRFQQLNLLDRHWNVPGPFDAIFCRNIMIYFDPKTQEQLLMRFAKMLKPGGLLFVGHSENFSHLNNEFYLRGQSVYELRQGNK